MCAQSSSTSTSVWIHILSSRTPMASSVCCPGRGWRTAGVRAQRPRGQQPAGQCAATFPPLRVRPSSARNDLCSPDATCCPHINSVQARTRKAVRLYCTGNILVENQGDLSSGSTGRRRGPIRVYFNFAMDPRSQSTSIFNAIRTLLHRTMSVRRFGWWAGGRQWLCITGMRCITTLPNRIYRSARHSWIFLRAIKKKSSR